MNFAAFRAELKQKKIRPAYLFSGEQDLLKEEALDELRCAAAGASGEVRKLRAREVTASEILDALRNISLFQPVGAVVVREASKLPDGEAKILGAALGALAGGPPLVFWDDSIDKRKSLFGEVAKAGAEVEFPTPYRREARAWVEKQAERLKHRLAPGVAESVIDLVGNDLMTLRSTLEKLSISVGTGNAIDQEAVLKIVAASRSHALWELQDAISSRQGALAVRLLRKALDEGEAPEALVGGLFAELRRLLLARELTPPIDANRDGPRIGARPFKVADLVRHSKEFSPAALRSAVIRLSAIDRALKTGRAAPAAALEQWVLSLCAAAPATVM